MGRMAAALRISSACVLLQAALGQQAGTIREEEHPPLPIARCTRDMGCTMEQGEVTLDSQWRWAHDGSMKGCFADNDWSAELCSDPIECANQCQLEGLGLSDYKNTYGVDTVPGGLKLDFAKPGGSVGSRLYLMSDSDNFKMFNLKNREFTFDVDVSALPCGLNGAVYFVEMDVGGGRNGASNQAGAKYGTGYCDAQCPRDLKFIGGLANVEGWNASAARGRFGACCTEMDLWEANREASAFTAHPCGNNGPEVCDWSKSDCAVCDTAGCDFNSYRNGEHSFYGPGASFDVDTTLPVTVVTQFITHDGTDTGELVEIRRLYVQGGKVIKNSAASILGEKGGTSNSITKDYCEAQKEAFENPDWFSQNGGLKMMGEAMDRGMVLVLSVWDDAATGMSWLDANTPRNASDKEMQKPGVQRGPCSADSGDDKRLRMNHPGAAVVYSNLAYGEIDSTYGKDSAEAKQQQQEEQQDNFCCLAASDQGDFCGTCFSSAKATSDKYCGQSETLCRSCGKHAQWCPAAAQGLSFQREPTVRGPFQSAFHQQEARSGDMGEIALTLEGLNVPPGLKHGDVVSLSLGGKEMQVKVVGVPRVHAPTTSHRPDMWGFMPVLQRNDADADANLGLAHHRRLGIFPAVGMVSAALAATFAIAARVLRRSRPSPLGDGAGLPMVLQDDEAVPVSPTRQLQFESPSPRRRRPDAMLTLSLA